MKHFGRSAHTLGARGNLFTQATIFFAVVPDIFIVINAVLSYIRKCVSVICTEQKVRWGSQGTPKLWVLNLEIASWHPSCAWNLEVTFWNLVDPWLALSIIAILEGFTCKIFLHV